MQDGGKAPDDCSILAYITCVAENAWAGGVLSVMALQHVALIRIFEHNGFTVVVSVRESGDDVAECGEMDWERKESCVVYINGKKSAEEQDRILFLSVGRVAGECPEHPRKVLMGSSAVSAC